MRQGGPSSPQQVGAQEAAQGGPSGTYQLGPAKRSKVNGKACAQQCRTPAVIPGAAPPRPKLGRGRRISHIQKYDNISGDPN